MIRNIINKICYNPYKIPSNPFTPYALKMKYYFSAPNHPTVDKILRSNDIKVLQQLYPQIGSLGQKNRQLALKLILNKIFSAKVPISILQDPKLYKQLQRNSQYLLQANLFCIKELMKSLNQVSSKKLQIFDKINNYFLKCFDNIKKINRISVAKYEVMLHKRFADYNLLYLSKSSNAQDKKYILQKSKQFYISSLIKMGTVIDQQRQKLKKLTTPPQQDQKKKQKSKEKSQQQQLRINALQQSIRMLIQTNSQNIIHLFMTEKQLSSINKTKQSIETQNMIALITYFQKSLSYYQIFNKVTAYSIFYHRVKKIYHQINYYSKLVGFNKYNNNQKERKENDDKMWAQLVDNLQKLYKETVDDIQQISKEPNHIANIQEMTIVLFNIRVHKLIRKQVSFQQLKDTLLYQASLILQLITIPQDKKVVSFHLGKIVKQMLEEKIAKKTNKPK